MTSSDSLSATALLAALPDAVVLVRDGCIAAVSPLALTLFAAGNSSDLIGRRVQDLLRFRSAAAADQSLMPAAAAAPQMQTVELALLPGTTRRLQAISTRVEASGGPLTLLVLREVGELARARETLMRTRSELRRLLAGEHATLERERKRIARDLHDDLQQKLIAIKIDLQLLAAQAGHLREHIPELIAQAEHAASEAIESTSCIVEGLMPRVIAQAGLLPALQNLVEAFGRRTGLTAAVELEPGADDAVRMPPEVELNIYRIAQEALNNIYKHAHASSVLLRLERRPDGSLLMQVRDDGAGHVGVPRSNGSSQGLAGMRERAFTVGGSIAITSLPGRGTTVELSVPARAERTSS